MDQIDPLTQFKGMAICPQCGCLDRKGTIRCTECGTFHSGAILEERSAPAQPLSSKREHLPLDPSAYSLGPGGKIPDESFDESEDVKTWDGGSSNFIIEEDSLPPVTKVSKLPSPEAIHED